MEAAGLGKSNKYVLKKKKSLISSDFPLNGDGIPLIVPRRSTAFP